MKQTAEICSLHDLKLLGRGRKVWGKKPTEDCLLREIKLLKGEGGGGGGV